VDGGDGVGSAFTAAPRGADEDVAERLVYLEAQVQAALAGTEAATAQAAARCKELEDALDSARAEASELRAAAAAASAASAATVAAAVSTTTDSATQGVAEDHDGERTELAAAIERARDEAERARAETERLRAEAESASAADREQLAAAERARTEAEWVIAAAASLLGCDAAELEARARRFSDSTEEERARMRLELSAPPQVRDRRPRETGRARSWLMVRACLAGGPIGVTQSVAPRQHLFWWLHRRLLCFGGSACLVAPPSLLLTLLCCLVYGRSV
jgi:hypothetical protein